MPAKTKDESAAPTPPTMPRAQFWSVAVLVSDKERSKEWYTRNFGLDVVQDLGHWITVGRKGENGLIHLCQTDEWADEAILEPGNQGIQFHLPGDFREACALLAANGVEFTHPPQKEEWGWWARVADPDGNELTLGPSE
jgi:catechol 2,3-dioxygenase-like lactoylglutathione lyase family enzyme